MKKLFSGLLFIAVFVAILPLGGYSDMAFEEEISLYLGQTGAVSVSSPKRVAVGNPAIADIGNISKSELTIIPKAAGNTTLVVWDNFGEQAYRLKVFTEDTKEIKRRVDNMLSKLNLPDVYTSAEDEEGKVALLGNVKDATDKDRITTALGPLKEKTVDLIIIKEETIIEIDVQILEVNRGWEKNLGFTWPTNITLSEAVSTLPTNSWAKLFQLGTFTRDTPFDINLDLLIKEGKVRVLSRPRISCLSGKEAKLLVGGQVPLISGTSTPGTNGGATTSSASGGSIEYKDYGIVLKIKPQVNAAGRVHINLGVEVSENTGEVHTQNALAYTFTKRSAETEIIVDDGQTVGLGGLIKQVTEEELQKFPWLGDIPVLGVFFRHKNTSGGKQGAAVNQDVELFVTLTTHIVNQPGAQQKELKPMPSLGIPTVNDDSINDPVLKYSKIIQRKIMDSLSYPDSAKEAGFQGTVKLSLNLSAQGDLLGSKVKQSSNYRLLDDSALSTAQNAAPFPPFSLAIKDKEIWVDIPVTYQLD